MKQDNLNPFVVGVVDKNVTANDGVVVEVSGEVEACVIDPVAAALEVVDYEDATRILARTAMRAVVKERSSDELGEARAAVESAATNLVADAVGRFGVALKSLSVAVDVAA